MTWYRIPATLDGRPHPHVYFAPPTTPSRAPPSPGARYARLDPDLDPDAVVLGLDLSAAEDMTVFAFRCASGKWRPA